MPNTITYSNQHGKEILDCIDGFVDNFNDYYYPDHEPLDNGSSDEDSSHSLSSGNSSYHDDDESNNSNNHVDNDDNLTDATGHQAMNEAIVFTPDAAMDYQTGTGADLHGGNTDCETTGVDNGNRVDENTGEYAEGTVDYRNTGLDDDNTVVSNKNSCGHTHIIQAVSSSHGTRKK